MTGKDIFSKTLNIGPAEGFEDEFNDWLAEMILDGKAHVTDIKETEEGLALVWTLDVKWNPEWRWVYGHAEDRND